MLHGDGEIPQRVVRTSKIEIDQPDRDVAAENNIADDWVVMTDKGMFDARTEPAVPMGVSGWDKVAGGGVKAGQEAPANPRASRWRRNAWTAGECAPIGRTTVSPRRRS